jgi:hypothetical protein
MIIYRIVSKIFEERDKAIIAKEKSRGLRR